MKNIVDDKIRNVFLKPGEIYVSKTPALISTVLGSCVSVTLHSGSGMGAICHAMLPYGINDERGLRYVDCAIHHIFKKLVSISGQKGGFTAKIFGGANLLTSVGSQQNSFSVGTQNIEAAFKAINDLSLNVAASDIGGNHGRKIFFYSNTGEVLLRAVRKTMG